MQHLTRPLPHQPAAPTARPRLLRWLASALLGAALLTGCASTSPPPGLQPVTGFDLQRYQGRWYELARLDHAFERGLRDVSATYTPQPDGSVQVTIDASDSFTLPPIVANQTWPFLSSRASS